LDFDHENEDATEIDPEELVGPEDQRLIPDRDDDTSVVPNDDEYIVDDGHDNE
jgi:hypothetical protein